MPRGSHFKSLSTEEIIALRGKNKITEHSGFKLKDKVRLKICAAPPDHKAVISRIKREINTKDICFWVLLSSVEMKVKNESWGPIWLHEIEKA